MDNSKVVDSTTSIITRKDFFVPSRVTEIFESSTSLELHITEASKSNETHNHLQSYILYTIKVGPLMVKRRYSEFEMLRTCLIKTFPTLLIPPIPEKQTLASNLTSTTAKSLESHFPVANGPSSSNHNPLNLIEYRKRMLSVFLNRCLAIDQVKKCRYFLSFLDPETNFSDFLALKENQILCKTSIYKLAPFDALSNLDNQIYLTLPVPSASTFGSFPELAGEEQFENFVKFENKFSKYETVLDNISRTNKRLVKHFTEMSPDLTELGSSFKALSLIQDSNSIENVGRVFDRTLIYANQLSEATNTGLLDKLIELKNFTKIAKKIIQYNRNKAVQLKMVEKSLQDSRAKYKEHQKQEEEISRIDALASRATGSEQSANSSAEAPLTDAELQSALYVNARKPFYGKIPGIKKINNVILKYTDPNPDQTRKNRIYDLRLKIYQLERQQEILEEELGKINDEIWDQLVKFHEWFKTGLAQLVVEYNKHLAEYIRINLEAWESCYNR
ncbi:hypothetical protein KL908_001658 [Ogataea polymorpha]|nr:hypothetical protein KL908_001658 [Ogataea polymorpha]